jgi:pimeloyl-ACP methyl ester carboxylesterase
VTSSPRKPWHRLARRSSRNDLARRSAAGGRRWQIGARSPLAPVLALVIVLITTGCSSAATPDSPGPTINLNPSPSGLASATPASQAPTVGPTATIIPASPSAAPSAPSESPSGSPAASVGPSATPSVGPSQSAAPSGNPSVAPSGATGSLAWTDCGAPFQCATLQVPLDYTHPAADQISLALIRLPASDPSQRIGSLLVNPGGPGASGVDFVQQGAETIYSDALRAHFDIVGFDPRGVGSSTPVQCENGKDLDRLNALDPTPDNAAERQALIDGAKEFDQSCETMSGKLLPFMSTADAARDMDRIRIALGEAKLTYFGFSYGTFLGTVYAGLFPNNIRALVLDGAIDPAASFDERNQAQAKGFADELNAFFAQCKADVSCAFNNNGDPEKAFDALMASIDQKPLPAIAIPDSRLVGPGEAFTGVLYSLYSQQTWPYLAQGLALAQQGDGSVLLVLADAYNERNPNGTYKNVAAANNAVNCLDYTVPTDIGAYDTLAQTLEKIAPRFGADIAYSDLTCAFWPLHPAHDPGVITAAGAPPILVVGTTGDPATPYQWAQALARELTSGVLLTRKGEGHTAYGESDCIDQAVDAYLISLTLPAANTTCSS